jgi:hypothetical protein
MMQFNRVLDGHGQRCNNHRDIPWLIAVVGFDVLSRAESNGLP